MKYLINSIRKLREDALPNMMYDVLQWLGISIILFATSIFIPEKTTFNSFLLTPLHFTIYQSILIILGAISLTTLCISLIFKARLKKIQVDYQTDELTGLKNYKSLTPYLEEKLLFSKRNKQVMSIVLIDIDDFAHINKKVGYNTADEILKKIGMLLGNDKRATDETFRYFQRGDEFLIVLNETSMEEAMKAAERKRKLIEKTAFEVNGNFYNLTVCCGVAECKMESDDYKSITDRAHTALINAKNIKGKNTVKNIA